MEKTRILVCDDEAGVRDSIRLILGREYTLTFVTNGEEAVAYVKKHSPDLLIMDIKMPKMSGLEALAVIKRARPRLKVLMITGYESSDAAVQAINLGADDYLVKPFDRDKLRTQIRTLLSGRI